MVLGFTAPPSDYFAIPGLDPNIQFLDPKLKIWDITKPAVILAFPCSIHDDINQSVSKHIRFHFLKRRFSKALEIKSVPVLLQRATYLKSFVSVGDKWILNGASGTRLKNQYYGKNRALNPDINEQVVEFFTKARNSAQSLLPVLASDVDTGNLDFAVECRNLFNFYHFLTETLGELCVAVDLKITGKVRIHSPTEQPSKFVKRWIKDLFPELHDRVEFVCEPTSYRSVLSSVNFFHSCSHLSEGFVPPFDGFVPKGGFYSPESPAPLHMGILQMNSFVSSLKALRERGLKLCKSKTTSDMPKRIWIGRKAIGKRTRPMKGQASLISALTKRGFVTVYLEDLSPIEQIATISNAEIIVSVHGAGLANMIFADPNATVIEIGNAHTAHYRWGDFIHLAHVSGCTYTSFFADMVSETPDTMVGLKSQTLRAVNLTATARQQVLSYISELIDGQRAKMDASQLHVLSEQLNFNRKFEAIFSLSLRYPEQFMKQPYLSLHLANAHKSRGHLFEALMMMKNAVELAPNNMRLFERTLNMAALIGDWEEAQSLLNRSKTFFPDHEEQIKDRFEASLQ